MLSEQRYSGKHAVISLAPLGGCFNTQELVYSWKMQFEGILEGVREHPMADILSAR